MKNKDEKKEIKPKVSPQEALLTNLKNSKDIYKVKEEPKEEISNAAKKALKEQIDLMFIGLGKVVDDINTASEGLSDVFAKATLLLEELHQVLKEAKKVK